MLETLMYIALGAAYIASVDAEKKEEERSRKEAEEIEKKTEMDIMFFYYSWYNNIPYEKVVELYKKGQITLERLKKCLNDHQ